MLLCPPVFHEYYKTFFVFSQIASLLSSRGYDVLRFDYLNTGDSSDADNLGVGVWRSNVASALEELKDVSGARRLSLVAARLGCCLLTEVRGLAQLVLWDPITDSRRYLNTLVATQRQLVAAHRHLSDAESTQLMAAELMGDVVSAQMKEEIARAADGVDLTKIAAQTSVVLSAGSEPGDLTLIGTPNESIAVSTDRCDWQSHDLQMFYAHDVVKLVTSYF